MALERFAEDMRHMIVFKESETVELSKDWMIRMELLCRSVI